MIRVKKKMTIPQYRERKEIFTELGYKEVAYLEKGIDASITMEIDENEPHYAELMRFERSLFKKGPPFVPIIILVAISFTLLSVFVILLAQERSRFDLVSNSLAFLLPSFLILLADVIYSYFYFQLNRKIIERGHPNKDEILECIKKIKE